MPRATKRIGNPTPVDDVLAQSDKSVSNPGDFVAEV